MPGRTTQHNHFTFADPEIRRIFVKYVFVGAIFIAFVVLLSFLDPSKLSHVIQRN